MKKMIKLITLIAVMLFVASWASAGNVTRLRVDVPFAFYFDKELLPAGEYIFEMRPIGPFSESSSSLIVFNKNKAVTGWLATMPGSNPHPGEDQLHFKRYGNAYFLYRVESLGLQANLAQTKAEKEFEANLGKSQDTILAAHQ